MTATIAVDASRDVRPIPSSMLGTNVEWIRNANGLYDPSSNGLNPHMVTLAQDLGVKLIRFPGRDLQRFLSLEEWHGPARFAPRDAAHAGIE